MYTWDVVACGIETWRVGEVVPSILFTLHGIERERNKYCNSFIMYLIQAYILCALADVPQLHANRSQHKWKNTAGAGRTTQDINYDWNLLCNSNTLHLVQDPRAPRPYLFFDGQNMYNRLVLGTGYYRYVKKFTHFTYSLRTDSYVSYMEYK